MGILFKLESPSPRAAPMHTLHGTTETVPWTTPHLPSLQPPSGAVIEGYSVVARLLNSTVVQAVNVSAPRLSLSTLTRGTSYSFEVAAYNSGGEGPKARVTYAVPPGKWGEGRRLSAWQAVV